jgi:hypothetical protein
VNRFSLTHLSNEVLRRELATKAARENEATAELLAHIAEFDERKLYLPEAYESMLAYCVGELGLPEEAAKKRLWVARAGRGCPGVFEALASGRVHLAGLVVLARHLSPENAPELLAAAEHKSREDIERLVADRFPKLDVPAQAVPIPALGAPDSDGQGSPGNVGNTDPQALTGADTPPARDRVTPLSAESYAVQFTRSREADERFRYAQDAAWPPGEAERHRRSLRPSDQAAGREARAQTLWSVREAAQGWAPHALGLAPRLACGETRRVGARPGPVHVQERVRKALRGSPRAPVRPREGVRPRWRGHDREHPAALPRPQPVLRRAHVRRRVHAAEAGGSRGGEDRKETGGECPRARIAMADPSDDDVLSALRTLGYRDGESRRALELCADMAGASAETKLRRALTYFPLRCHNSARPTAASATGTRPS